MAHSPASARHPPYSNQNGQPNPAPRTPDERQRLLSFQRYSYSVNSSSQYEASQHEGSTSKKRAKSFLLRTKDYLNADITTRWADLVLLVCFFVSGMVDAGAYNAYSCFVSMQVCLSLFVIPYDW
jgi:hypothetical protein